MGLAERFKEELKSKNIFEKSNIEKNLEKENIQFISKPINNIVIKPEKEERGNSIGQTINNNIVKAVDNDIYSVPKFEELETEIISKIRKTPYWNEYSIDRQKNMIEKYFKIKTKHIKVTNEDKNEFIKSILILSNNK
ncbi:unknown [Clostridium sp. CAG:813]|nr:unknown [Clostridium sp. CAG:813]